MKIISPKIALTVSLLFFTVLSFAQKDFQGKVYYQTKTFLDMGNFGGGQMSEAQKKQIAERMKSALEKTYILTFNPSESLYKEEEKLDAPAQGGGGMRFGMMSAGGGNQYKNIKDLQLIQERDLFGKQFLVKDSLSKLNWDMGTETKMIGQYMCFKATAIKKADVGMGLPNFNRNNNQESQDPIAKEYTVTVWYTPQIPVSQGPGDYWGLPGLILEVHDDTTVMLCSKIVLNPTEKETIKMPSKGKVVTKEEYEKIAADKQEEMRQNSGGARSGGGFGGGRRGSF
ncbi:GLPGLI family protein [Confluentibacter sediminis]|uniref:GLPGLI family protein n=1 Tax=Confluentibacter sediminis TaxID=2219045 RepID=UPI000DAEA717|nr:GLPGLI family protein [Confluentibacter sediminis]